jgi:carbonic anhydrase
MVGAKIGDLFVHRNVANQVNQLDQNVMSALQYAVEYLKVTNIVVAGHYDCGGIQASLTNKSFGHLESWLSQIRKIRYRHINELKALP